MVQPDGISLNNLRVRLKFEGYFSKRNGEKNQAVCPGSKICGVWKNKQFLFQNIKEKKLLSRQVRLLLMNQTNMQKKGLRMYNF